MRTRLYFLTLAAAASLFVSGCSNAPMNNQTGGTIIGGVGGAMLGSTIGGGSGRILGAGLGALGGGLLGNAIGANMDANQRAQRHYDQPSHYDDGYYRRNRYDDRYGY